MNYSKFYKAVLIYMRYVALNQLKEGMVLGKPFYGRFGGIMLQDGAVLTSRLLEKINEFQYSGLYIQDEFSEGITVEDIISEELRHNTVRAVHSIMTDIQAGGKSPKLQKNMQELSKLLDKIIDEICMSGEAVVNMIDLKVFDLYTYYHSVNVCVLSCVLGTELGMTRTDLFNLALAATLHDLGKMFIPKDIINKARQLDAEEFEEVKKHSLLGYEYLKDNFNFHYSVNSAVLQHHERHDGKGYPLGKKGNDIFLPSRIIAVTGVFDAITSRQTYREPMLPSEAYEYILGNSGQHFHPDVVDAFVKRIAPFPTGMKVLLSNGLEGIVYENHAECLSRPLIKLYPLPGQVHNEERFLDLLNDNSALNITIKDIVA